MLAVKVEVVHVVYSMFMQVLLRLGVYEVKKWCATTTICCSSVEVFLSPI